MEKKIFFCYYISIEGEKEISNNIIREYLSEKLSILEFKKFHY